MKLTSWTKKNRHTRRHEAFHVVATGSEPSKKVFSKHTLRFSKRAKYLAASATTIVILISVLVLLLPEPHDTEDMLHNDGDPSTSTITQGGVDDTVENDTGSGYETPINNQVYPSMASPIITPSPNPGWVKLDGIIESADVIDSTVWRAVAEYAWQYFERGNVIGETGLPGASIGSPYFTDWDLAVYIQALLDAYEIGFMQKEGANYRLDRVVTFLENRQLTNEALPYWIYNADNGEPYLVFDNGLGLGGNVADSGILLAALHNLKIHDDGFATRVNNIVYNKTNYTVMLDEMDVLARKSINIYDYLVASGFAAFWPEKGNVPTLIVDNIMSAPRVDLMGVELPASKISCEPILLSIFHLPQPDPRIRDLSRQVYLAHEAWYNATGTYRAFSEGFTMDRFAYEWVILPDGKTWVVQDQWGYDYGTSPIIFSKVAFGFLSLYNTTYARDLVVYLEDRLPELDSGYCEGVYEDGGFTLNAGSGNTNGLIVSAARYAIQSGNWP